MSKITPVDLPFPLVENERGLNYGRKRK